MTSVLPQNVLNGLRNGSWQEKVFNADSIYAQVKVLLEAHGVEALPTTPRRPDIRLIVENKTGDDLTFTNPGKHSDDAELAIETIPSYGDDRAAMIMVSGDTLEEQTRTAQELFNEYNLGEEGFSPRFVADLNAGKLEGRVTEAYGPAPFQVQTDKLKQVEWESTDGSESIIDPVKGQYAAYGARPPTNETVFLTQSPLFVQGTKTIPELIESNGMAVAVSTDWQTQEETTRPIVPSVAGEFYGEYFLLLPVATVNQADIVEKLELPDGKVLTWTPEALSLALGEEGGNPPKQDGLSHDFNP